MLSFTEEPDQDDNLAQCYDEKSDPKGEKYDGFANTTVSGRKCQVIKNTKKFASLSTRLGLLLRLTRTASPSFQSNPTSVAILTKKKKVE